MVVAVPRGGDLPRALAGGMATTAVVIEAGGSSGGGCCGGGGCCLVWVVMRGVTVVVVVAGCASGCVRCSADCLDLESRCGLGGAGCSNVSRLPSGWVQGCSHGGSSSPLGCSQGCCRYHCLWLACLRLGPGTQGLPSPRQ